MRLLGIDDLKSELKKVSFCFIEVSLLNLGGYGFQIRKRRNRCFHFLGVGFNFFHGIQIHFKMTFGLSFFIKVALLLQYNLIDESGYSSIRCRMPRQTNAGKLLLKRL